jgi:hypothetical protein
VKQRPGSLRWLLASVPLILVLLGAGAFLVAGCSLPGGAGSVSGSGTATDKSYDLSGFTGLRLDNRCDATVTRGDTFSVTVTVDDNLLQHLVVEIKDDTLRIGLDPGNSYSDYTLRARVTMPDLSALELSGASLAAVSGFSSTGELMVALSGASRVSLSGVNAGGTAFTISGGSALTGELQATSLGGDASGGSRVAVDGGAVSESIEGSGGSHFDLKSFPVQDADVQLSGGSSAAISVNGRLNADVSGGSRLDYAGSPLLGDVNASGSSQINHVAD